MAFFKIFLLFVAALQGCSGLSFPSSIIDQLKLEIEEVTNKTRFEETRTRELIAQRNEQTDRFKIAFSNLEGLKNSGNEEIVKIIKEIKNLQLERTQFIVEKTFLNTSVYEEEQLLHRSQYGLKWLEEDLALVQERENNRDQVTCLEFDGESADAIRARLSGNFFTNGLEVAILELELSQAVAHFNDVKRGNEELLLSLAQEKVIYASSLIELQKDVDDVVKNLEEAKATLEAAKKKWEITKNELEQLKTIYNNLKESIKEVKAEAARVLTQLKSYEKAVACYAKYEAEAGQIADDDTLTLDGLGEEEVTPITLLSDDLGAEPTVGISADDLRSEPATPITLLSNDLGAEQTVGLSTDDLRTEPVTPITLLSDDLGAEPTVGLSTDDLRSEPATPITLSSDDLEPEPTVELSTDDLGPEPIADDALSTDDSAPEIVESDKQSPDNFISEEGNTD